MIEKLKMQTPDITKQNIEKIAEIFPNVLLTESKDKNGNIIKSIDFDLLKQSLSSALIDDDSERYRLDWPGKKASLLKANTPITKTLRPCRKESVKFDATENIYIEGDSFEVLKILQESYLGKIKIIYIDPPYNTGKDFIYKDDFKVSKDVYEEIAGAVDEEGGKLFKNTDSNGRFHSDWLSMMYERILIARDLLKEDGVIFISIGDNEVHNLRKVCDEVFGEDNFVTNIIRRSKVGGGSDNKQFAQEADYILCVAKSIGSLNVFYTPRTTEDLKRFKEEDEKGIFYWDTYSRSGLAKGKDEALYYEVTFPDQTKKSDRWRRSKSRLEQDILESEAKYVQTSNGWNIHFKQRVSGEGKRPRQILFDGFGNTTGTEEIRNIFGNKYIFDYPKPSVLVEFLVQSATKNNSGEIILDFFSGSATTADAIMALNAKDHGNRKFIMVQLAEKTDENSEAYKAGYKDIPEIGKERIRRAGNKILEEYPSIEGRLDVGFRVYKLDTTNIKDVERHPEELEQISLIEHESNIKEGRSPEDILTQVVLNLGLELSLPIEQKDVLGNTVFIVQTNALVACFDDKINFNIIDEIAELKPFKVVFKDASFVDDKDRINVEERFKRLSPETVVTVI